MRIRSTKPEFWRSKTIAALAWDVRLVLKGLESYVDDNGVGKDDLALIAADVFPRDLSRDPRETLARLSEAISTIAEADIITRYTFSGEDLLYIERWKDIQRIDKPGRGRFPRPDGTLEYSEPVNRDSYGSPRETVASPPEVVAPGTGEQGSSGAGNRGADDEPLPEPPDDPYAEVVVVPEYVDNPSRPTHRTPGSGAKTVVRQVLGNAYPRAAVDRLAVQVEKLTREGQPDNVIREALVEWDRRDNCDKPEYLPTVLSDVVKQSRATANVTAFDRKKAHNGAIFQALADQPNNPELLA